MVESSRRNETQSKNNISVILIWKKNIFNVKKEERKAGKKPTPKPKTKTEKRIYHLRSILYIFLYRRLYDKL